MKTLYPEIKPYQTFFLETGSQHSIYVEQCGNPQGIPVVFLHGGPCSGCKPDHRRYFDPQVYRIILFDQRGCGDSLPFGELENNSTQDLIDDMERIRRQLKIEQWLLFGGSWGGALALLYAQQHTDKVSGMIVRGVFLARRLDLDWFAREGVSRIYPEQWARLLGCVPESDFENLIDCLCKVMWGDDEVAKRRSAREWSAWSAQVSLGEDYQPGPELEHVTATMVQQVQMELHYAQNHYFIEENQIIKHCKRLQSIPTVIIHGRNDLVCPIEAGFSLNQALSNAKFIVLPKAGHVARGAEMIDALVTATDNMQVRIKPDL